MPAFSSQTRLIDSQSQIEEVCDWIVGKSVITLDTEFVRTNTYYPKLCLIQLATDTHLACVDVLANIDTLPLRNLLVDGPALKIFHAAKQDLEAWHSTYGQLPAPIFDTQIAAGFLGYPAQIGYANLVQEIIGVRLEKDQTRTDWSRRPLSSAQIEYARNDVLYLPELHRKLQTSLEALGRSHWVLEDCASLIDPGLYVCPPEDAWNRLSGIPFLPVPAQARARHLAAWRERRAQKIDRPRQWVLADKAILMIANSNPHDEQGLKGIAGIPPGIVRNQGRALLREVRLANAGLANGRIQLSQIVKATPPDPKNLKQLSGIVGDKAAALGIPPEILAARRELVALMRGERNVRVLKGWRLEVIGEDLLDTIAGC